MDHAQANEMFSSYWDGELEPEAVAALEAHLRDCSACRHEYDEFKRTMGALGVLGKQPAPPTFSEGVVERLRRRSGGRLFPANRISTRFSYEIVSILMLLIVVLIYLMAQLAEPGSVRLP